MFKIAVCDDEKIYRDKSEMLIKSMDIDSQIWIGSSGKELLEQLTAGEIYNIYIVDIEIPDISGIDLARSIKDIYKDAVVILLTNYEKYVYVGYEVSAFRYIQKENMDDKLPEAITSAIKTIKTESKHITVKDSENVIHRLFADDIIYMEKYKKYVVFHTCDNGEINYRSTLSNVMSLLNSPYFIEIQRGFVINAKHIKKIEGLKIVMDNGSICYISREKNKPVKEMLMKCWEA